MLAVLAYRDDFRYSPEPLGVLRIQFTVNVILFPILALLLLLALGLIRDVYLNDRKQRIPALITTMIFYWWSHRMFSSRMDVPDVMVLLTLGAFIAVVVAFIVTMVLYKVSLHTVGMGVLIALPLAMISHSEFNVLLFLLTTIVLAGWVGTARLVIGQHSRKEIYSGYLLGIGSQLLAAVIA
jgi:hypothetical protein